jgi:hypothetical protein
VLAVGSRLAGSGRVSGRRLRLAAVLAVLAASIPYTAYAWIRNGARRAEVADRPFDDACTWILRSGDRPGPVLTRHPGEVFLATGRQALEVPTAERPGDRNAQPAEVAAVIDRYRVAYILVDDARYLGAAASPLLHFVEAHPERVNQVGAWGEGRASVVLYEVAHRP